ncbi:MAG: 3-phosphoshikimate 1-carboxyvinyltransferase [Acidobacteriota bacterium]|nr:3-phosphoshikimate 1-carboxyvinyltransferase [Acidobacteriota bacterium]
MRIEPATAVVGHVAVPGDKSISHRAVLLGAIAEGDTHVRGFGRAGDTQASVDAIRALGVEIDDLADDELVVHGGRLSSGAVDCANAGTLMRLLLGLVAGRDGRFELTGDASLSVRPMERVAGPLRSMGARIDATDGHAPLVVEGTELHAIDYELPVASAQVKSAILLAGLTATGETTVVEPVPTRDHTELMLEAGGARIVRRPTSVSVQASTLRLGEVDVPGDFSSAAPLLVAAALVPGSDLTVHGVGLNPRRTGLLDVLERMGARVAIFNRRRAGREPVGDVQVHYAELSATELDAREVPLLVDELPLVALLAAHAHGETVVRGAAELRVKESDRIEAVTDLLRATGAHVRSREDGWVVTGVPARLRGGRAHARGDHRIAMLGAVVGLTSREGVEVEGADAVAISFPGFYDVLDSLVRR